MQQSKVLFRSRMINALQPNRGFLENRFNGTKPKIYNRLLLRYNRQFQIGYLAEKDAGELSVRHLQMRKKLDHEVLCPGRRRRDP